jgi:hypothetical protein
MDSTSPGPRGWRNSAAIPAASPFYILPLRIGGYDRGAMPLLHNELARWRNGQLEVRPQPLRVKWLFDDLVTSDGHGLRCTFTCSVQGLSDPTERRMLQEVLLEGRHSATDETLAAHFTPALRAAAERVAGSKAVASLLDEPGKASVAEALRAAGNPVAFACGVELLPPFHVDAESPTLQQQRLLAMQRAAAEQQAAGQIEHFQRAAELLRQFQSLRQAAPELSAGQVLQQISPVDRGPVLQTLLLASAKGGSTGAAQELWAVAGPSLVRIAEDHRTAVLALPESVGPLRSVQPADLGGSRALLVGARSGFLVVRPDAPDFARVYADPDLDSPLGFSRIVHWAEQDSFVGCHGDGGIVRWSRGDTARPAKVLRTQELLPAAATAAARPQPRTVHGGSIVASVAGAGTGPRAVGPRHLQVLDPERLVFSLGPELRVYDGEGAMAVPGGPDAEIVAILPDERRLHVVHEDGTVCVRDRRTLEVTCRERRTGRVRAAAALPWLGEVRLLLAGDDGPVQCIGFDDQLVTQYATVHRGLRLLAGCATGVVAVSPDRQRVILWNSWDGRKPAAEVAVAAAARHRIADVAFG